MPGPAELLAVARSQLGVHEDPPYSNRVLYSAWYGMVGPWCDMFVSWCAAQSGNAEAVGRFAYTPSHEAWFRSHGCEVPIREAQAGDIVFFNFIGRTSHVGIVEANHGDGLITIEGNTNGSGSRDGGSVMRHFRSWSSGIVSVQRPKYLEDEIDMAAADDIKNGMLALYIKTEISQELTRTVVRRAKRKILAEVRGQAAVLSSVEDEVHAIRERVLAKAEGEAAKLGLSAGHAQDLVHDEDIDLSDDD